MDAGLREVVRDCGGRVEVGRACFERLGRAPVQVAALPWAQPLVGDLADLSCTKRRRPPATSSRICRTRSASIASIAAVSSAFARRLPSILAPEDRRPRHQRASLFVEPAEPAIEEIGQRLRQRQRLKRVCRRAVLVELPAPSGVARKHPHGDRRAHVLGDEERVAARIDWTATRPTSDGGDIVDREHVPETMCPDRLPCRTARA